MNGKYIIIELFKHGRLLRLVSNTIEFNIYIYICQVVQNSTHTSSYKLRVEMLEKTNNSDESGLL